MSNCDEIPAAAPAGSEDSPPRLPLFLSDANPDPCLDSVTQGLLLVFVVLMILEAIPDIAALCSRLCGRGSSGACAGLYGGLVSWWERATAAKRDIATLILNAGTVRGGAASCWFLVAIWRDRM
jgi:hypothetical protein